jgi:hypothetical protein
MNLITTSKNRRSALSTIKLQVIASSRTWTPNIERFAFQLSKHPVIVIQSGPEVLAYSNIDVETQYFETIDQRFEALSGE